MTSTYREANQAISNHLARWSLYLVYCTLSLLATTSLALPIHTFGVPTLGETCVGPKIQRTYSFLLFSLIMLLLIILQKHEQQTSGDTHNPPP
jgi:hypothetical protein